MKRSLHQHQHLKGLDAEAYKILRSMCHLAKNFYNKTLHTVRQYFFDNGAHLNYYHTWKRLKHDWNYEVLPSQVAKQTMKQVDKAFHSFFKLVEKKR